MGRNKSVEDLSFHFPLSSVHNNAMVGMTASEVCRVVLVRETCLDLAMLVITVKPTHHMHNLGTYLHVRDLVERGEDGSLIGRQPSL